MFCTQCGCKLDDGAKFCTQCGCPVDGMQSSYMAPSSNQPGNPENSMQLENSIPSMESLYLTPPMQLENSIPSMESLYTTPPMPPKRSKRFLIPLLVGVVALVLVLVVGGFFLVAKFMPGKGDKEQAQVDQGSGSGVQADAKDDMADGDGLDKGGEDAYLDYLKDVLIPTFGMFNEYRSTTLDFDYYGSDLSEISWADDSGILAVDIDDYDGDGDLEMFFIRTRIKPTHCPGDWDNDDGNRLIFNMCEYVDGQVKLTGGAPLAYHTFYENIRENNYQFRSNCLVGQSLNISMLPGNDGPFVFCEFGDWGIISDGVYNSYCALKYDGKNFVNVAEISQEGEGSSGITFASYEFSDGAVTDHVMFFNEDEDEIGVYKDGVTNYFASHGIAVKLDKTELYNYSNDHTSILASDDKKQLVQYTIAKDEEKSTNSIPALKATLTDSTKFHSEYYDSVFSGDPDTYVTCYDYEYPVVTNGVDAYYFANEYEYENTVIKGYKQPFPLKENDPKELIFSPYSVMGEENVKAAGIYKDQLYFYNLFYNISGDFCYRDVNGHSASVTFKEGVMLPVAFQDNFAYFTTEEDPDSTYYGYNLDTDQMVKITDWLVESALCAANGKICYAETSKEYSDFIGENDLIDCPGDDNFVKINIVEANPDGSDKNVLVKDLKVREIMKFTSHCMLFVDDHNLSRMIEY